MSVAGPAWFKSSYSGDQGGNCLEVACDWRKSTYSGSQGGDCVEVATHATAVHVRDSKNDLATGAVLTVSPHTWNQFLRTHVTRP
ncbi:DUF397 domain-containing protein [Streptomyces sp. NPDC016845]|uniref:DUF397 domain-containing protein n=1 Tax=Streptomyces sp. NPDC016845 TaxID=3364972 RepID=UPI00379C23C2